MLYSEFIEGTNCKDNDHNYQVYKNLEAMYMNTDMSKADIYEYGKKLVDNSKSEKELRLECEIKEEIANYKSRINDAQRWISYYKLDTDEATKTEWPEVYATAERSIEYYKNEIRQLKNKIAELKWIIA